MNKNIIVTLDGQDEVTGLFLDSYFYQEMEGFLLKKGFIKNEKYSQFSVFSSNMEPSFFFKKMHDEVVISSNDIDFFYANKKDLNLILQDCNDRLENPKKYNKNKM